MRKSQITLLAVEHLKKMYPEAVCSLSYSDPFQLLVATRLSAQCTDERVNKVTPTLFAEFPTPEKMAAADVARVSELIKSCGFYKMKSNDLVALSQRIEKVYGGKVPDNMDDLLTLQGVGRKTANLILGDIYGKPAVVCDTHFIRLCNRLGLVDTKDPLKVETAMRKLLPGDESSDFCHRAVLFGRDICTARHTYCERCSMNTFCKSATG